MPKGIPALAGAGKRREKRGFRGRDALGRDGPSAVGRRVSGACRGAASQQEEPAATEAESQQQEPIGA
jgi:hypothetical protein